MDPMFKQLPSFVELDKKVSIALAKYNRYPSIISIIQNVSITQKFEFSLVSAWEVVRFVEVLETADLPVGYTHLDNEDGQRKHMLISN